MSFATPQLAAEALARRRRLRRSALLNILGPDGGIWCLQRTRRYKNAAAQTAASRGWRSSWTENAKRATFIVGNEDWPSPIPIVQKQGKWYFDTKAGRVEVLLRRIGENELAAINICRGFVEAQIEYADSIHDNSGVNQYAQKLISTPGKQDGLAWRNPDGSWGGPVGEGVVQALEAGYVDKTKPFHGYYFKVLKGQGPDAVLGRLDYVIGGAMIGGFALVAVPANYRVTGVKTFMVSYDGLVLEKDLGPDSLNIVKNMELYNPDKTWRPTDDGQ
jgi:hypothetical protein